MHLRRLPPLLAALVVAGAPGGATSAEPETAVKPETARKVQLGPRPYYLVEALPEGPLKQELQACAEMDFRTTRFAIGHRGAALQFPEHTRESYVAAARMGAGIIECDATFTRDKQLVCRHAQCDLHLTTDILATELAATCAEPFTPARFDPETGERTRAASARCCSSDVTLAQFKTLCGRMNGSDPDATDVAGYLAGTPPFRTDLYSTCGTVLSHAESIALIDGLGADFTPELKFPEVEMPFDSDGDGVGDYSREDYARQLIAEYEAAGIDPARVWPQSFDLSVVRYWIETTPSFGRQAVFLDGRMYKDPDFELSPAALDDLAAAGVKVVAPPLFALLELDDTGVIVPSRYAKLARAAGLELIAWTLESSGRMLQDTRRPGGDPFFHQTTLAAITGDGHLLETLHVLAADVGVIGVFSDWPATVSYYASCMGLD